MKHFAFRLLAPTFAALALSTSGSAQTIDNFSNWDGNSGIGFFGNRTSFQGASSTFGQTFVAPAVSFLKSWRTSFRDDGGDPFTYRFYVAPWDDAHGRLAAAPLFTSGDLTSPTSGGGYVDLDVAINLLLTPGTTYVAFTSTAGVAARPYGIAVQAAFSTQDTYLSGGFVMSDDSSLAGLAVNGWYTQYAGYGWDTAFRAEFRAVPEPTSIVALGAGALALTRRRKALKRKSL